MIKIEIKTEEKDETGEQIGVFYPIVAAYVHESGGISAGDALQFRHPPSRPVLFAVTNDINLRQAAVGYELHPSAETDTAGRVGHLTGYVEPNVIVALPETDTFRGLNIANGVQEAKVAKFVFIYRRCCYYY